MSSESQRDAENLGARRPINEAEKLFAEKYGNELFVYAINMSTIFGKGHPDFAAMLEIEPTQEAVNAFLATSEVVSTAAPQAPSIVVPDSELLATALSNMTMKEYDDIRRELQSARLTYDQRVSEEENKLQTYQRALETRISAFQRVKVLEKVFLTGDQAEETVMDWLKRNHTDKWWELVGAYREGTNANDPVYAIFASSRIVLSEVNAAAGINLTVDLGRVCMVINLKELSFFFTPYTDNLIASNYFHPHISGTSMCLGEGSSTMGAARTSKDLATMMAVARGILCTYNASSPYRTLAAFEQLVRRNATRVSIETCDGFSDIVKRTIINKGIYNIALPNGLTASSTESEEVDF